MSQKDSTPLPTGSFADFRARRDQGLPGIDDLIERPKISYPQELIFNTAGFVAGFQPHSMDRFTLDTFRSSLRNIFGYLGEHWQEKTKIYMGFEVGAKTDGFTEVIPVLLQDSNAVITHKGKKYTYADVEHIVTLMQFGNASDAYASNTFDFFLFLQKLNGPQWIVPFFERSPHKSQLTHIWHKEASNPQNSVDRRMQLSAGAISEIITRDLRFAQQILDLREKDPHGVQFILRGTGHIGLVPALQSLSKECFPNVSISDPYQLRVTELVNSFIQLTWNKRLYEEIISENNLNLPNLRTNDTLLSLRSRIQAKMLRGKWGDVLRSGVDNKSLRRDSFVNITLSQDIT